MVKHASAKSYAAQATKEAGWAVARADQTKRARFRKDVLDHASVQFVPFPVTTCVCMDKEAVWSVNRLGDIAADTQPIPKCAFVPWAMLRYTVRVGWYSRMSRVCELQGWWQNLRDPCVQHLRKNATAHSRCYGWDVRGKKKTDRTSRQTQVGIGHSAPAHRGGHVQNRISRRQVRRGKIEHNSEAEQPRTD